jgi:hypothetical protein
MPRRQRRSSRKKLRDKGSARRKIFGKRRSGRQSADE